MTFPLLVVIHETLISAEDSILLHADPSYYGSYHALIHRSGKITYLVPGDCKAYAAANSSFTTPFGEIQNVKGSVDDFAYHIALETPFDGVKNPKSEYHIGYTKEQYTSLGWLVAYTGVGSQRIVTHGEIITPTTLEPRCFNFDYFYSIYLEYQKTIGIKLDLGILNYGQR